MDRGAWWATVHGLAKSQTGLRASQQQYFLQLINKVNSSNPLCEPDPAWRHPQGFQSLKFLVSVSVLHANIFILFCLEGNYFLKSFSSSYWNINLVEKLWQWKVQLWGSFPFCYSWPLSQHIRFSLRLKLQGVMNNVWVTSGLAGRVLLPQRLSTQHLLKSQEGQISHLWSTAGQPLPYAQDLWLVSQAAHSHPSSPNSSRASNPFEPRLNRFWKTCHHVWECNVLLKYGASWALLDYPLPFYINGSVPIFGLFIIETWCVWMTMYICIFMYNSACIFVSFYSLGKHTLRLGFLSQNEFHNLNIMPHHFLAKYRGHIEMFSPHWAQPASIIGHSHCSVVLKEETPNLWNHFWWSIRRQEIFLISFPLGSAFQESIPYILAYLYAIFFFSIKSKYFR